MSSSHYSIGLIIFIWLSPDKQKPNDILPELLKHVRIGGQITTPLHVLVNIEKILK